MASHLANNHQPESLSVPRPIASPAVIWDIEKDGSPYPGLLHFMRKYAPVFFGRDAEICEILDRMRSSEGQFILVSGDSGVGKSSLVAAGVLPHIEKAGLPGGEKCEILHMLPGKTQQPWSSLMVAGLGALATRAGLRPDEVLEDLNHDPGTFAEQVKTILKKGAKPHTLLVFLDQMEELFTSQDITQSNQFLTALYHAAQENALWIVATIRSDHLHHCHRHPEMVKVLRGQGHYPLGRVEPFMMQEMIVKPADCAGLKVSERLARRLIDDTGADSANLPLLAFALNQLFEKRTDHELSEGVYDRLGGVGGAIAAHVTSVEDKIKKQIGSKAEETLPSIFQTLVNVQKEEGLPTRNRPPLTWFEPDLRKVVDLLVTERLLRTEGHGEAATVSISHEKLFEAWPALREYVETHKKMLMDRTLLESRARKWVEMGKPWGGSGLAYGREYKDFLRAEIVATPVIKQYLRASHRAQLPWRLGRMMTTIIATLVFYSFIFGAMGFYFDRPLFKERILKGRSFFGSIYVEPDMQVVSTGTFRQGDIHGRGHQEEQPVHDVTIRGFAIGTFEVTFEEYDRFALMTNRPMPYDEGRGRGRQPVINVSWDDARDYAGWLSEETGKRYRLPTEAEWEYVARSIVKHKDDIWAGTSDEKELDQYAVYYGNAQHGPSPVGKDEGRRANALGLYDMSGNVWEWVEDCWHKNYEGAPTDGSAWLKAGGGDCGRRVVRGGSWLYVPEYLRASFRGWDNPDSRLNGGNGFRLAQDIP